MKIARQVWHRLVVSVSILSIGLAVQAVAQDVSGEGRDFGDYGATAAFGGSAGLSLLLIFFVLVFWSLLPLIICYRVAGRKGKGRGLWVFLSIIFGWIAVLVLAASASER